MSEISIIAAYAENFVIGNKGKIPWNIPGEQNRFKKLTVDNVVIMGRKTFEEIYDKLKKPLPGRINIVISSDKKYSDFGCSVFSSLKAAIEYSKEKYPDKKIFVSGGALLYKEALKFSDKMYLTEIDLKVEGDVFFPRFNETDYVKTVEKEFTEPVSYRYVTYTRN